MKKGFTLVELLIVIGILAVLATAAVVVLNPTELLKQARDSQRIADLDTISAAISLYLADVTSPDLTVGTSGDVFTRTATGTCPFTGTCEVSADTGTDVDGTGWVRVNFTSISGGSPVSVLPMDPTNSTSYFYAYAADESANTFELNAVLESTKFATTEDLDGTDGGSSTSYYEIGNDPDLDL